MGTTGNGAVKVWVVVADCGLNGAYALGAFTSEDQAAAAVKADIARGCERTTGWGGHFVLVTELDALGGDDSVRAWLTAAGKLHVSTQAY